MLTDVINGHHMMEFFRNFFNDGNNPDKYNKWLVPTYVFNRDSEKITRKEKELEDLLDKNVKEIKELMNRIGDLPKL